MSLLCLLLPRIYALIVTEGYLRLIDVTAIPVWYEYISSHERALIDNDNRLKPEINIVVEHRLRDVLSPKLILMFFPSLLIRSF
jgi:hypothetical protein